MIILGIGGLVLTIGDVVMKKWVNTGSRSFYIVGLAIYLAGLMFLAQSYKYKNIAVASVIFVIFNIVTLSLVSWLYFKEKPLPLELGGIVLGIVTIIVMELAKK